MRRINPTPISLRAFSCPQCNKLRMNRPLDHVVNIKTHTYDAKDGTKVDLLIDICDKCQAKNFRKYFEPTRADVKRILKSMKEDATLAGDQSLEELL